MSASTCCICLEELPLLNSVENDGDSSTETSRKRKRSPIDTNCGHRFHSDCIQKWINTLEGNGLCPICREAITVPNLAPRPMLTAWRRIQPLIDEILDNEFVDGVFWGDEDNSQYENFWDFSNEYFGGDEVSENYSVHSFNFDFEIGSNNRSNDEDDSNEENIRDNPIIEVGSDNENGDNSSSDDTVSLADSSDDDDIWDNSDYNLDGDRNSDNNWDGSFEENHGIEDSDQVVILEQDFEDNSENGDNSSASTQESNSSSENTFTLSDSSDDEDIWGDPLENNR